jgi:hypothetical protein
MCSGCTIFNVSSYASHQSTSLEGTYYNIIIVIQLYLYDRGTVGNCLPISACPRTPDVPMFAVMFCSTIIQRPITHAPYDIRQGKVPYLYNITVRNNDTGSLTEEICVNETYNNLTSLITQCTDLDDNATLSCNDDPNICLRLRARLSLINSTCEPATEFPSTIATTLSSGKINDI